GRARRGGGPRAVGLPRLRRGRHDQHPGAAAVSDTIEMPTSSSEQMRLILSSLRLRLIGSDAYAGASLPQLSGRIYGGQVLAQALVAADDTLPAVEQGGDGPRQLHSVHGYFLRPGSTADGVTLAVERLHDGRSFSTRRTHAF